MPRHISFSGNGSKTLNIISTQKADLTRFTQAIFTLLNVKGSDGKLELLGLEKDSSPKLATCREDYFVILKKMIMIKLSNYVRMGRDSLEMTTLMSLLIAPI